LSMLKVAHLTFSIDGGAGKIATRLASHDLYPEVGQQVFFLTDGDIKSVARKRPLLFLRAIFDYFVVRNNHRGQLFTLYRKANSKLFKQILSSAPDVIHIHWYPGAVSLQHIEDFLSHEISIVVTLHDMYPMTGGCHFSEYCDGFKESCQRCPQVKKAFYLRVQRELESKRQVFSNNRSVVVTSPAHWLCDEARQSSVFQDSQIVHIPNPIDLQLFKPLPSIQRLGLRDQAGLGPNTLVLGFCASNISDPRKNFQEVLSGYKKCREELGEAVRLVVIGDNPPKNIRSVDGICYLGRLSNMSELINAYSLIDVFCSLSTDETFPNTIHECAALGIPSILSDIPGHRHSRDKFGLLVTDSESFGDAIRGFIADSELKQRMSEEALSFVQELSIELVSHQYLELYKTLKQK
jgi:glycosyltransferase involved in cell wall biosynthesis